MDLVVYGDQIHQLSAGNARWLARHRRIWSKIAG
jgi:hypothetical protein